MVKLTKKEKEALTNAFKENKDENIKSALKKINDDREKPRYEHERKKIKILLKKAFQEKRRVRIQYYSLSSDETRFRTVLIYQYAPDWIMAHCELRDEERCFVTDRIRSAALLDEKYAVPSNWKPHCNVWSSR
jgi:predicted DNA-binding transcriptional regulator YafY